MHKLDHIVFGASTLEEGTSFIEDKLQIKLSNIGYHNDMGTHNRVVKISKSVYLEIIAIDTNSKTPKSKRWFNLDNPKLQSKLRKKPKIIGYVIENKDVKILKYYDPFFKASRGDYKWKFAMPNSKKIPLDKHFLLPSLINWESQKAYKKMQDNHLNLEKFEIILTEKQVGYKKFIKSLGDIEKLTFVTNKQDKNISSEKYPKLKITIKDKVRNLIVTL